MMKTRVIIFARRESEPRSELREGHPSEANDRPRSVHVFAVSGSSLEQDLGSGGLAAISTSAPLLRHDKFDWAVGEAGRRCTLWEFQGSEGTLQEQTLRGIHLPTTIDVRGQPKPVKWLPFPEAVRALTDGTDRRLLQLAVQYLAAGGIPDDVIAADIDNPFLKTLKDKLEVDECDPSQVH